MTQPESNKNRLEQAGEALFDFAVERDDVKTLVAHLSVEAKCKPATVEYELQILKIVSTGWALSFFLENIPYKAQLAEATKEMGEVQTRSPDPTPRARQATCRADVPLFRAMANCA